MVYTEPECSIIYGASRGGIIVLVLASLLSRISRKERLEGRELSILDLLGFPLR